MCDDLAVHRRISGRANGRVDVSRHDRARRNAGFFECSGDQTGRLVTHRSYRHEDRSVGAVDLRLLDDLRHRRFDERGPVEQKSGPRNEMRRELCPERTNGIARDDAFQIPFRGRMLEVLVRKRDVLRGNVDVDHAVRRIADDGRRKN